MFWSLVLFGTAMIAGPAVATAGPDATLYEVTEEMNLRGGKLVRRMAVAALSGTVNAGTALCPAWLASPSTGTCAITAIAHNNVSLATGRGPIHGTFAIVVQDLNTADGPEVVVIRGTVTGQMDLSPALLGPDGVPLTNDEMPLGGLEGTWSATGVPGTPLHGFRARGALAGTFRLPVGDRDNAFYLEAGGFVPVQLEQRALGDPTVKLEINFKPR
jgi:hypothetical protein